MTDELKGRQICAWCIPHHDMGPSNTVKDSHGMCEEAAQKFEEEAGKEVPDDWGRLTP